MNKEIFQILKKTIGSPPKVLHEPYLDFNDEKEVLRSVRSAFVSTVGKHVVDLENQLKKFLKSKYVLCLNSGTSALHISLKLLGANERTEIMMPSLTYVASANSVIYNKADPYFIDVNEYDYGLNPETIINEIKKNFIKKGKTLFNKKTKKKLIAIMPVHVFGIPSNMKEIMKIAKKYGLAVIEDAADSLGSKYKNKLTGTFGKIGVLSFNGNKTITSGSGGAIITNEKKIYLKAKHLISISKKNHQYEFIHDEVGWNYRMNNLNASLGLSQIKKLNKILKLKKKVADNYKDAFYDNKYCEIVNPNRDVELNNWINLLRIKDKYNKKKNKLLNFLVKKGFFCRAVWRPMHLLPHLKNYQKSEMKNTMKLYSNTICLPSSANLVR
jgi:dTDP-4-amino-4,6-dideoxygalactose transaminase|tara:strand:+ start:850 stop:2001 length:1152 start_codon:yes stop_codon:yes gene_type:complete